MLHREGLAHGAKAGDRGLIIRLRVSEEERDYMDARCQERNQTRAYAIRIALADAGLMPPGARIYGFKS